MLPFIARRKQAQAQETLIKRLQGLLDRLDWIEGDFALENICHFFNRLDLFFEGLNQADYPASPEMARVEKNTRRSPYGWFRAPEGQLADEDNTYICPTGVFADCLPAYSVRELALSRGEAPTREHYGVTLKEPLTLYEFYGREWVRPFIRKNCLLLRQALVALENK